MYLLKIASKNTFDFDPNRLLVIAIRMQQIRIG